MNDDDLSKTLIIPNPGGRRKSPSVAIPEPASSAFTPAPIPSNTIDLQNTDSQFDGENIRRTQTPTDLDMDNDDTIDVIIKK